MTSTHRRNSDLVQRCSTEVGTTVERVKVMNEVWVEGGGGGGGGGGTAN